MKIYVNGNNEIKDVDVTSDPTLTELCINDDESNPFATWSTAKICCYKAQVDNGMVVMMTPYVDSRIIEHIDRLGRTVASSSVDVNDLQEAIAELAELVVTIGG